MADFVGRDITADVPGVPPQLLAGGPRPGTVRSDSFNTRAGQTTIGTDDIGHDVTQLYAMVEGAMVSVAALTNDNNVSAELRPTEAARMKEILHQAWESVREWLAAHPSEADRQQAAMHQGQFLTTVLHMVCKLADPPVDVVQSLIDCAGETVTWPDANGWLPLHHACANGASGKVLSVLVQAYPEGKVQQDKRFRTPLHFAFFRRDASDGAGAPPGEGVPPRDDADDEGEDDVGNSMAEIVQLLADSGAAELQDEGGMLPMHYASAYGTTREVLEVLLENYPESITKGENKGRNALHLAMVNAHRKSSPKVVGFLLEKNAAEIINSYDDDHHLPIHLLAMASKFPAEKVLERKNASECLKLYLNAKPKASADFLTSIQTLPEWLRDIAVISDHIQDILNHKIVMPFATMILGLDFFFNILVILAFELASKATIEYFFTREGPDVEPTPRRDGIWVTITLVCGGYFLLREAIQIVSLVVLGNFGSWLRDKGNLLDVLLIFFTFYYGSLMHMEKSFPSNELFRSGVAVTKCIMWFSVISFLQSARVEFSVFVSGVKFVIQKLATYMMSLAVILLMFAQMFNIVYTGRDECKCTDDNENATPFPHCKFETSLIKVYTMLMGEIGNEMRYSTSPIAQFLYLLFAFLVVILLSNVLIAIVTDSYGVIKNERAAMVFWSNRLDFVAEMDAIKNIGKIFLRGFKSSEGAAGAPTRVQERPNSEPIPIDDGENESPGYFRNRWDEIMNLFDAHVYEQFEVVPGQLDFWCIVLLQFVAVVFIVPVWLVVGLCTFGWLWPPQVREFLLKQKKVAVSRADIAEQLTAQINDLKNELKKMRAEMKSEMKNDRKEFAQVKADVVAVQTEVMADLLQVKEIMVLLLNMSKERLGP